MFFAGPIALGGGEVLPAHLRLALTDKWERMEEIKDLENIFFAPSSRARKRD
jgi:hypothetical protein